MRLVVVRVLTRALENHKIVAPVLRFLRALLPPTPRRADSQSLRPVTQMHFTHILGSVAAQQPGLVPLGGPHRGRPSSHTHEAPPPYFSRSVLFGNPRSRPPHPRRHDGAERLNSRTNDELGSH